MTKKITELNELTTPSAADVLPIVDVAGTETKKITYQNLTADLSNQIDAKVSKSGDTMTGLLTLNDNMELSNTTHANLKGVITKGGNRFIHDFNYGNNGTVTTSGNNLFIGENAGNFTMGSTATNTWQSSGNIGIGINAMLNVTTGYNNLAMGTYAMRTITTGNTNVALGSEALDRVGTGSRNTGIGYRAGRFIADGSTNNENYSDCFYLGALTKASASGNTNETVIGYNATGNGSNTVTLGHTTIVTTVLQGNVRPHTDNEKTLGTAGNRWSEIFAGNGTINTSDANEKQQIQALEEAEIRVAKEIKKLVKKFKFNDAVEKKGDNARIHAGFIAQEIEQAFIDEGLNPENYSLFCKDTWQQKIVTKEAVVETITDETGLEETKIIEPEEFYFEEKTRLGLRYNQILSFVISVL